MRYFKREQADGGFTVWWEGINGRQVEVEPTMQGYIQWLGAGNIPEIIPYVAPLTPAPIPTSDRLRLELLETESDGRMDRIIEEVVAVNAGTLADISDEAKARIARRAELREWLAAQVTVTEGGDCYHTAECDYLGDVDNDRVVYLTDAFDLGLTACEHCNPLSITS